MANWPELTLALTIVLIASYLIADVIARLVESGLRAILPDEHERIFVDRPKVVIRFVIFLIVAAALAFPAVRLAGFSTAVGGNPEEFFRWLLRDGLKIALICIAAYAAIRIGSAAARRFEHELSAGTGLDVIERTKRAQTLSRITQKTLSVLVFGMAGLMILRQLDVDITPVLTGAGIVGLAVGFGAQTLVRDVISGFFLILEDQVRVGDVAVVNGQGGLVEAVNLRTIVLRDEEGTVHVVPNGEVKTLSNRSKDFSYYVFTLGLPYETDPDMVASAVKDAGDTLMHDPAFRPHILEPVEVYGVDDFQPGQLVIKGRIKTVPQKQWMVGRELRKRIAAVFKDRRIELPVPHMSVKIDGLKEALKRD
jgi:moderate conductance mechanosensitive channel